MWESGNDYAQVIRLDFDSLIHQGHQIHHLMTRSNSGSLWVCNAAYPRRCCAALDDTDKGVPQEQEPAKALTPSPHSHIST